MSTASRLFAPPRLSLRFVPIWRRHFLVWRKLTVPSILGNLADPLLYMLGFGYGLGALLPEMQGISYIAFIAAGTVCSSTMMTASFEAMYSSFSRMHVQRTWDAILNAPIDLDDVVIAEIVWAASKALLSGMAVLAVATVLGLTQSWLALWIVPLVMAIGLVFASLGLVMTALSPSYDFFTFISGVFFPLEQLPEALRWISQALPLYHGVALVRALFGGEIPALWWLHLAVPMAYAAGGFCIALALARRRLMK